MAKATKKKISKKSLMPKAIHAKHKDGSRHLVGIGNLRVLIVPDDNFWFAQGVEIDYAAQGDSVADAKKNFERGFSATIDLHLRMYGNIEKLLTYPHSEVLREASRNKCAVQRYTQVSVHAINANADAILPFTGIDYLVAKAAA